MAERTGFAISVDGTPISYTVSAPGGEAPTAIFCDGIGCDGFVWRFLNASLSDWRRVHWHYRGHGRSRHPRDPRRVGIPDLAGDLRAVMDDAGVGDAVLFGHSMGVQVVLEAYRQFPDRVRALVLLCGAPGTLLASSRGTRRAARVLPRIRRAVRVAPSLINGAWKALAPTGLSHYLATRLEINAGLLDRADFQPYLEGLSRVDLVLFFDMLDAADHHDAADLLPHVDVPTLVVAGERDGFTPARRSREMAEAIPHAELLLVEGGSHTTPIERPHLIDQTVRDFLRRRLKHT